MRELFRAVRRRLGTSALRALIRISTLLRLPLNSYLLLGVPTRVVALPADPVAMPQVETRQRAPIEDLPAALARSELGDKFRGPRPSPNPITITAVERGLADTRGLVLTRSGRMVNPHVLGQASLLGDWRHQIYRPRPSDVAGTVGNLSHPYQRNLFHWLFEILPRIAVFEAAGVRCDRFYAAQQQRFQRESLALLGLAPERIVPNDHVRVIRAERLLAVSHWDAFSDIPAWTCDFLRERVEIDAGDAARADGRIYISRSDAAVRRLLNEEELLTRLTPLGFRRVVLAELSFAEQVALFRRAAVVIGPHGAGLSNAVFCRPGAWLVELCAPRYVFGCWCDLARKCGLRYSIIPAVGMDFETDHGWRHQREDFHVEAAAVHDLLEQGLG